MNIRILGLAMVLCLATAQYYGRPTAAPAWNGFAAPYGAAPVWAEPTVRAAPRPAAAAPVAAPFTPYTSPIRAAPFAAPAYPTPYGQWGAVPVDIDGDGIADVMAAPGQPIIVKVPAKNSTADSNNSTSSSNSTDGQTARRMMQDQDLDTDALEFLAMILEMALEDEETMTETANEDFDRYDANGDGVLDHSEMTQVITDMMRDFGLEDVDVTDEFVQEAFDEFDKNSDDQLSRGEFRKFTKSVFQDLLDMVYDMIENPEDWE
jgi:Ca2+-binding EF-hand superfamily protein